MAEWYKREGEKKESEIEFKPDEFKKEITTEVDKSLDARFKTQTEENDKKMKPLLDMAESIKADKEAREKIAREASEKKTREENEVTSEDFLVDPAGATKRIVSDSLNGTNTALLSLAARTVKTDTLSDKEYYHGDIKTKIDAILAQQPLKAQVDPSVVLNAYKVVVFDHQKDITDGKIKARTSSGMFESSGTGGHSGDDGKDTPEKLSEEEKMAAKAFGMKEEDWAKSKRELTYV